MGASIPLLTIDREAELPIKRQAQLLGMSRGAVCHHPELIPEAELALMRRIDELHLEHPFAGSRMLHLLKLADAIQLQSTGQGAKKPPRGRLS